MNRKYSVHLQRNRKQVNHAQGNNGGELLRGGVRVQGRWVPGLHPAPRGGGARHRPGAQPRVLPEGPPGQHPRGVQRERRGAAGHGLLRLRAGAHPQGQGEREPLPLQRQGAAG